MKANELRIGNYINYLGKYVCCNINTIYAISKITQPSVMYLPIPLTEELLLKCGFGKSDEHEMGHNEHLIFGFYYDYHFKKFRLECDDVKNGVDINLDINYIHQLQNIFFALTNQELKIIL